MPINRKFNLAALMDACAYYCEKKHQRITFEYILIENVNDGLDQVMELARPGKKAGGKNQLDPLQHCRGFKLEASLPDAAADFLSRSPQKRSGCHHQA